MTMNITSNDQAIIEQALKVAAAQTTDYQEITQYQEVLKKMSSSVTSAKQDGFRYDYDDYSI
ncbi:hypothetical protein AMD01_02650 [Priestia koreensis]|uniref:Uncharacterized protein n=2 Tax=Priestia koreensis TaxID=284581 RepID=A0A0M0LHX8_9BACI|nr:hypothetical protein AMD01_02650 [Priestia koreensis]